MIHNQPGHAVYYPISIHAGAKKFQGWDHRFVFNKKWWTSKHGMYSSLQGDSLEMKFLLLQNKWCTCTYYYDAVRQFLCLKRSVETMADAKIQFCDSYCISGFLQTVPDSLFTVWQRTVWRSLRHWCFCFLLCFLMVMKHSPDLSLAEFHGWMASCSSSCGQEGGVSPGAGLYCILHE